MTRSVLLTGASGFLGTRLSKKLIELGYSVHAISHRAMPRTPGICIHPYLGSYASIEKAVFESKADSIMHLAAYSCGQHTPGDVDPILNSTVHLGTYLLEAIRQAPKKAHFINTGSFWEHYGDNLDEATSLYAAAKQAFEQILIYFSSAYNFRTCTLTLYDVYGPEDPRRKILQLIGESVEAHVPLKMSPGDQVLRFLHVDDAASAYLSALHYLESSNHTEYERFDLGINVEPIQLRKFVELYERVHQVNCNIEWGGRPYRAREIMQAQGKGCVLPNWNAEIELSSGLRQCPPLTTKLSTEHHPTSKGH